MRTARLLVATAAAGLCGCATVREVMPGAARDILREPVSRQTIRVALVLNKPSCALKVTGPGTLYDREKRRAVQRFTVLASSTLAADGGGVTLNGRALGTTRLAIIPDLPQTLWVNDTLYRGTLDVVAKGTAVTAVNSLGLEEYLLGVVPRETFPSWPEAALCAQAVACRSFAVYHIRHVGNNDYDVIAPMHQLYGGVSAEDPRTSKAVADTQGQVLMYNNDVLCAFFHTSCGGRTEEARNVFANITDFPRAVSSGYEVNSPHHSWRYSIDLVNCEEKLRRDGKPPGGAIVAVNVLQRFPSGRVARMRIAARDRAVEITGEDCRRILGYDKVKSTLFNVGIRGDRLEFAGRGWGHGVGLCQWSSKGMADRNFTYRQILAYFYPGTTLALQR